VKNIIADLINQNNIVFNFLETSGRDYDNADKLIPAYIDLLTKTHFNAALGLDFANLLQLSNDKTIFEQYDLKDISSLFDSLIKLQDFNLDTYVDAANFQWAVMDDADKAERIAKDGIERAQQKIAELRQLLDSIKQKADGDGA